MQIHFRSKLTKEEYNLWYECWVDCYGNVISTYEDEDEEGVMGTEIQQLKGLEAYVIVNGQDCVICPDNLILKTKKERANK